ncbi:MAG: sensor histidine kinase, partial [Acidimicrobiales bacterium]
RRTVMGLRPVVLDDLGLAAALTSLAGSLGGEVVTHLDLDELDLPPHVEASLFRIAQEALQNVVKHSSASEASLKLRGKGGSVTLTVSDNGVGFDPGTGHGAAEVASVALGLRGMQERAALLGATLSVESAPGTGTRLRVEIPAPPP